MRYAADFVSHVGADDLYGAQECLQSFHDVELPSCTILEVADPISLNKVVAQWREYSGGVAFFRGQGRLYRQLPLGGAYRHDPISPTQPRGLSSYLRVAKGASDCWYELDQMLQSDRPVASLANGFKDVPEYALEGLFQHYEGGTRWLDVVDNLQVALWMATRGYHTTTSESSGKIQIVYPKTPAECDGFIYLYLFALCGVETSFPGLKSTRQGTQLLDLREALPARFLRPHSQHSALLKLVDNKGESHEFDGGASFVVVRMPLEEALSSCGGTLLRAETLFPRMEEDKGFQQLNYVLQSALSGAPMEYRVNAHEVLPEYIDVFSTKARALLRHRRSERFNSVVGHKESQIEPSWEQRNL